MLEVKVELNVRDLCGLSDVRCCVFVSFERVRERGMERREKERKRDSSRNRSYHARTQARKGNKKKQMGCLFCPAAIPSKNTPSTEQNRSYALCSSYFSLHFLLPLASLAPFSQEGMHVQACREKSHFSLCLALSFFSLSLSQGSAAPEGPGLAVAFRVFLTQKPQAGLRITRNPSRCITLLHV